MRTSRWFRAQATAISRAQDPVATIEDALMVRVTRTPQHHRGLRPKAAVSAGRMLGHADGVEANDPALRAAGSSRVTGR
jgi:hypothetical protein